MRCKKAKLQIDLIFIVFVDASYSDYNISSKLITRRQFRKMKKIFLLTFVIVFICILPSCMWNPEKCEHTNVRRTNINATCQNAGGTEYYCHTCMSRWFEEKTPRLEHTSGDWSVIVEPTCEAEGENALTCRVCNEILKTEKIPALGHNESDWFVRKKADCTNTGERFKQCWNCYAELAFEIIPYEHDIEIKEAVAPTCSSYGYTEYQRCRDCWENITERVQIDKLPHTWTEQEGVEPTCSSYGYTDGIQCSVCNTWQSGHEQIDRLPHTPINAERAEPTCTETGIEAGTICSICSATVEGRETIRALGHNFSRITNICERCPEKEYYEIDTYELFAKGYGDLSGAVIYLNKFILDSDTNSYVITLGQEQDYLRLVGDSNKTYNLRIVVKDRETRIDIDFVNVNLSNKNPIIYSESDSFIDLGLYGDKCSLVCSKNNTGASGERGADGSSAICVNGELQISLHTNEAIVSGGDGGNGGNGSNMWGGNGKDGGDGGDGASAIIADSVTVALYNGVSRDSIVFSGGCGGSGGEGGTALSIIGTEGPSPYKDGEAGIDGSDAQLAVSVGVKYIIQSGK